MTTQPPLTPTELAAAEALAVRIHGVTGPRVDVAGCADMARAALDAACSSIQADALEWRILQLSG